MQIKTPNITPYLLEKNKRTTTTKKDTIEWWQGFRETKSFNGAGSNVKWFLHSGKQFDRCFKDKAPHLRYVLMITFLGIYSTEMKTYCHAEMYTWMFIDTSLITAKSWKQPRCHSIGERMNKLWYIQTMK